MPYMKAYCNHCEKEHEVSSISSLACPTCFINMKAERDRLRDALEEISVHKDWGMAIGTKLIDIAKEALKEASDEG